jgi:glycosyltransferase involved in cell wall biosynthesis
LGTPPKDLGPMNGLLDQVELLGRVGHPEVPSHMAAADVFVFPSLFEGSAVVTYEALACGLPCIVTAEAGSVVRHGVEGFHVPARDVSALAAEMRRFGEDPRLRARTAAAARSRALDFDWPRYHLAVADAVASASGIDQDVKPPAPSNRREETAAARSRF